MLVIWTSDGAIRWMDVSAYLKERSRGGKKSGAQIVFEGEPFDAVTLQRMRNRFVLPPE
jgi:hypothetical protein